MGDADTSLSEMLLIATPSITSQSVQHRSSELIGYELRAVNNGSNYYPDFHGHLIGNSTVTLRRSVELNNFLFSTYYSLSSSQSIIIQHDQPRSSTGLRRIL